MAIDLDYKGIPIVACSQDKFRLNEAVELWRQKYPQIIDAPFKTISKNEKPENLNVREITKAFALSVTEPTGMIFSLENANKEVQNALLISLEKINQWWRPLILVKNIHTVIPTVLSRSTTVYLPNYSEDELVIFAEKNAIDSAFVKLANGSMAALKTLDKFSILVKNLKLDQWLEQVEEMQIEELLTLIQATMTAEKAGWAWKMLSSGSKAEWVLAVLWNS